MQGKLSRLRSPQAVLVGVTLLWATTFPITKDLLGAAPPLRYLAVRFTLGAALLYLWARRHGQGGRLLSRDALWLGALQVLGLLLQVLGQPYTTASKAAFLTALSVPLTPLCGLLLYRERPRPAQLAAVLLGFIGLALLTYPQGGMSWNRGDLLCLGCAAVYALVVVETARRAAGHDALRLATAQTLVGAGLFSLVLLIFHLAPAVLPAELRLQEARPLLLSGTLLWQGLYLTVVCTAVTYAAQTWAMARLSATESAVIFALEPVFASGLALIFLGAGEWPGLRGAVGAALVLAAVFVAESC